MAKRNTYICCIIENEDHQMYMLLILTDISTLNHLRKILDYNYIIWHKSILVNLDKHLVWSMNYQSLLQSNICSIY